MRRVPSKNAGVIHPRSFPPLIMAAAVLTLMALSAGAQQRSIRIEQFALSSNGKVRVENFRGPVRIEGWNERNAKVVAQRVPSDAPIAPADLKLMSLNGDVTVECAQNGNSGRIDLTIYVPIRAQLQVTGGAWPVEVSGSFASAVIQSSSGDIGYKIPATDNARLIMHSGKGVVRSAVKLNVDQKDGLRGLEGSLGDGSSPIILTSKSGNITLTPFVSREVASVVSNQNGELEYTGPANRGAQPQQSANQDETQAPPFDRNSIATPPSSRSGNTSSASGYSGYDPAPPTVRGSSSGETVFAGHGESSESSSVTRSGVMLPRPRKESDTREDSMGMRARIIPSDATSGGARDPRYPGKADEDSLYDSPDDPLNQPAQSSQPGRKQSSSSAGGSSSSSSSQSSGPLGNPPPPPVVRGPSDEFVFGGDGHSENSKGEIVTSGIIPHPLAKQDAREDSSGLRVRIIPAESTAGGAGDPRYPGQESTDKLYNSSDPRSAGASKRSDTVYDSAVDGTSRSEPPRRAATRAEEPSDLDTSDDESYSAPRSSGRAGKAGGDAIVLESSLVSFNVSVKDATGRIISGLSKDDFQIYENNQAQQVEFFSPSTAPFNLVLLLDLSGSISDRIDVVKSAALHFLDVLGPQDKVAVAAFTRQTMVLSELTSDRELLRKRIKDLKKPEGGTAFYEAMWFSLTQLLRGTKGQRNAIVVVSDGVDNSLDRFNPANTRVSFPQLARRLEASDCIVFPIYVDTEYEEVFERGNTTSEAYAVARDQLARMAAITGGETFRAERPEDLAGVYTQVADALRTVYSVGYYPTDATRDGSFRRVSVTVDKPGSTVRTRRGYFAR